MRTFILFTFILAEVTVVGIAAEDKGLNKKAKVTVSQQAMTVAQANNTFALDLYRQLAEGEGNIFCSPYSIHQAFVLAWSGGRGDTAAQMAGAIKVSDIAADDVHNGYDELTQRLNATDKPYELSVANAMWLQKKFHFLDSYLRQGQRHGAELRELDFAGAAEASRQTINAWVEEQTNEKIKDLLPSGTIDGLTRMVLTNAIYFKGDWVEQFDKKLTKEQPFHLSAAENVGVELMYKKHRYAYAQHEKLQVLELPYRGEDLSMVVLLPKAIDGLAALESQLTDKTLRQWLAPVRKTTVRLYLPNFKLEMSYSLNSTMQALGMTDAFDIRKADFSGITGSPDLYITDAVHKAFVEVNEEGTEAAAATGIVFGLRSARPRPEPVFRADHPFVFLIRDNHSGTILFMGRITNPKG